MSKSHFSNIPDHYRALRAAGMDPLQAAASLGTASPDYDWPSTTNGWDACLKALVGSSWGWVLLLSTLLPQARRGSKLTRAKIFSAFRLVLSDPQSRYAFIQEILLMHRSGLWGARFLSTCLRYLTQAGVHPYSLALCSYPTLTIKMVASILRRTEQSSAIRPVGYGGEKWRQGIAHWFLDLAKMETMDGILTTESVIAAPLMDAPIWKGKDGVLGNRMLIGGKLDVAGFAGITTLGDDTHVYGDLVLERLSDLTYLGSRLSVEGDLVINGCPSLRGLPPDLKVTGLVFMEPASDAFQWGPAVPEQKRGGKYYMHRLQQPEKFEQPAALDELQGATKP